MTPALAFIVLAFGLLAVVTAVLCVALWRGAVAGAQAATSDPSHDTSVHTNAVMFAFNLFPLPPLDGGRILVGLLPWKQAVWFSRVEPYGFYIVMALVVMGFINAIWMTPIMDVTFEVIRVALIPFKLLLQP